MRTCVRRLLYNLERNGSVYILKLIKFNTVFKMPDIQKIGGFHTIWLRFDAKSSERHQIYLKEHSIRNQEPEFPKGKTLYVLNIPPYATAESIKGAFTDSCGPVESATLKQNSSDSQHGFKNAYVVFSKDKGLEKALSLKKDYSLILSTNEHPVLTGIQKWCKEYNDSIGNEQDLRRHIKKFMEEYDQKEADRLEQEKAAEEEDEEGWTTVTGRKKRGKRSLRRTESTITKVRTKDVERQVKKQLLNFYSHQIRETNKQNLVELRKKFELDKKKLEQMKSKRKFKPF